MKKLIIFTLMLSTLACNKEETDNFEIKNDFNANVEVESRDVSHLKHAAYTILEDGKLVVLFSQFDLGNINNVIKKTSTKESSIKFPNQIFYLGIYPAKEGNFPDLTKYQIGAINYNKIILNTDLSISLSASQKYVATHLIIDASTPPIELGKYNISINKYEEDSFISGEFNGMLLKINLETEKPDLTSPPLKVNGSFDKAEYIDYQILTELLPIDISNLIN